MQINLVFLSWWLFLLWHYKHVRRWGWWQKACHFRRSRLFPINLFTRSGSTPLAQWPPSLKWEPMIIPFASRYRSMLSWVTPEPMSTGMLTDWETSVKAKNQQLFLNTHTHKFIVTQIHGTDFWMSPTLSVMMVRRGVGGCDTNSNLWTQKPTFALTCKIQNERKRECACVLGKVRVCLFSSDSALMCMNPGYVPV